MFMKSLILLLSILFTLTVYSQFEGIALTNIPVNQNEHFLFSVNSDTIINGSWAPIANYPQALFGVNCYYWPASGKVFTCGGATVQGIPQKDCYNYNPLTNLYEPADSLPLGRWSGKIVRVKDSLYLVGSANVFSSPDGMLFKYSPMQNQWIIKDTMPSPRVHEPAVCVFKDTLIICIGGSTNSFSGSTNTVRIYNPYRRTWRTMANFPISTTTGHAECNSEDSSIVVVGGYGAASSFINTIYRGKIKYYQFANGTDPDSIGIEWKPVATHDTTIFHTGVYRVGGGRAGSWMLFGPALRNAATYHTVYAVNFNDDTTMYWYRMIPNIPDSAGSRPTLAVNYVNDSAHIYLFSGNVGLTTVSTSYKYSFAIPVPVGVKEISGNIPAEFRLYQNYPNPFNPVTKIKFDLSVPQAGLSKSNFTMSEAKGLKVILVIYDILGREVAELINEHLKPGMYEIDFDGSKLSSGIYFYRLSSYNFSVSKVMILVK